MQSIIHAGVSSQELPNRLLKKELGCLELIAQEVKQLNNRFLRKKIGAPVVNIFEGIPPGFCIDTDHKKFFYPRIKYLHKRYREIQSECKIRKLEVENNDLMFRVPGHFYGDWYPSPQVRLLVLNYLFLKGVVLKKPK